jgi:hypothetical protein
MIEGLFARQTYWPDRYILLQALQQYNWPVQLTNCAEVFANYGQQGLF